MGGKLLCLVRQDENSQYHTGDVLKLLAPETTVLDVAEPTAGAACTALLAVEYLNNDEPLLIMNGDQIITADVAALIADFQQRNLDGGIVVFRGGASALVVCEMRSRMGTWWKRRKSALSAIWRRRGCTISGAAKISSASAMDMIRKDAHVGGLFYVCPAYNELILKAGQNRRGKN